MRLIKARVQNYRSIKDSGEFTVEKFKTILVGPNEAGKTVLLQALQQLNKPEGVDGFDPIRDYPRSLYNDLTTGKIKPKDIEVVRGYFELDDEDKQQVPTEFQDCIYVVYRKLDNTGCHSLENFPNPVSYKSIKDDLLRLSFHMDRQFTATDRSNIKPSDSLNKIKNNYTDSTLISGEEYKQIKSWLDDNVIYIDETDSKESERRNKLLELIEINNKHDLVLNILEKRIPKFVLFNNYFKVKPSIHLEHLSTRLEKNMLDGDKYYDYGNLCLLKFLGFNARDLSDIGKAVSPDIHNSNGLKKYKDTLDNRTYQLNAASVKLTKEIKNIWNPNPNRSEAEKIRISADGQYLKVVIEDDLGVEIELDQRSEGFQWLVSFYVVFFAEAMDKHKNAILLLDEPGTSLHGLKQRDFRGTISRLAENNQTIYTTHSPFLVGSDELDLVRVIEMKNRDLGTKVHTTLSSSDPAGLLPLQEALGYDLAQSLFSHQKNLVLEGLTDYWYVDATAQLLREANIKNANLDEKIALVFANSAGKVVYYATILHAQKLKVAALLDSDSAGDNAAKQENLLHTLGNKNILRTKDYTSINKAEIEDLLRDTLPRIVEDVYKINIQKELENEPEKPIMDILQHKIEDFSKYKLAKSYIKWTKDHKATDLTEDEINKWSKLIQDINKVLK